MQNQARDGNLFDYFYEKPVPIAPQSLTGRLPSAPTISATCWSPLDREAVRARRARTQARRRRVDRGLLPVLLHEPGARAARPAQLIAAEFPGVHVSLSSEVLPRIREWPRLSTTLLNAYLEPVMVRYIDHLEPAGSTRAGVARSSAS